MGVELYKNNAGAVLNGTISIGGTTLNLASGQGSRFPTPTGGDDFRITIFEKDAGGTEINYEIARCTARVADALTIARDVEGIVVAAGGTSGGWAYPAAVGINPSGVVYVQMRETAGTFEELLSKRGNLSGLANAVTARSNIGAEASANKATDFSTVNHTLFPTVQAVKSYADALVVGLWDDRGSYNASGNTWPSSGGSGTAGAILKGDIWSISTGGTLGGSVVTAGDTIRALQDTPGTTAGNWAIGENNIGYVPENSTNKDASGGYVGMSGWSVKLRNAANTFTNLLSNTTTAARAWAWPDKDGTIAMTSDVHDASAKTPVDADELGLMDSAASWAVVKVTLANFKAFLKTYFDSIYATAGSIGRTAPNFVNSGAQIAQRAGLTINLSTTKQEGQCDNIGIWASGGVVSAGTLTQVTNAICGSTGYASRAAGVTLTGSGQISTAIRMESKDAVKYKNKTVSFSVKVDHDVGSAINYTLVVKKPTVADTFGTLSTIATSSSTSVATATGTTLKFENVSVGDCTNGLELEVQAACGAVTTKNFNCVEFSLDISATAQTYEASDVANEYVRCQRYFEKSYNIGVAPGAASASGAFFLMASSTTVDIQIKFAVAKRVSPTMTFYSPVTGSAGKLRSGAADVTANDAGVTGENTSLAYSGVATSGSECSVHFTAAAGLF